MIKLRSVTYETTARVVDDVCCNRCGTSLKIQDHSDGGIPHFHQAERRYSPLVFDEATSHIPVVTDGGEFYGLVEATVSGGYSSTALADMAAYRFSLCEHCLAALFDAFVLPVEVNDASSPWATPERKEEERLRCLAAADQEKAQQQHFAARKTQRAAVAKAAELDGYMTANPAVQQFWEELKACPTLSTEAVERSVRKLLGKAD